MKINCSQCGADLPVLEKDFYLRCPYCEATIFIRLPSETISLTKVLVSRSEAMRPFSREEVSNMELLYFPYRERDGKMRPAFNQPVKELEIYTPPMGDKRVFSPDDVSPESLIPFERESDSESGIVYHPFYRVSVFSDGFKKSVFIDGVSGKPLLTEKPDTDSSILLQSVFVSSFITGLCFSIPVYILGVIAGCGIVTRLFLAVAFSALAIYLLRIRGRMD